MGFYRGFYKPHYKRSMRALRFCLLGSREWSFIHASGCERGLAGPKGPKPGRQAFRSLPIVSIVVPFFGLSKYIVRILQGNPQKGTTMETIGRFRVFLKALDC